MSFWQKNFKTTKFSIGSHLPTDTSSIKWPIPLVVPSQVLLFYPEKPVKEGKSRAWNRYLSEILKIWFSGYFSTHVSNPDFGLKENCWVLWLKIHKKANTFYLKSR